MIRVAAHKLGSISSSPQSATVLTILTQPTDLLGPLHSPKLFHSLSNWHLFTWLLIHSILPTPHTPTPLMSIILEAPPTPTPHPPHCFGRSKAVICTHFHHTCVICGQRMWRATGTLWGVKIKSVLLFTRLFLRAGKWGDHGVLVMRLRVSQSA